jgi:hypothetical protein
MGARVNAIALAEAAFDLAVEILGVEAAKARLSAKLDAVDAAEDAREAAFGDETITAPETPDAKGR